MSSTTFGVGMSPPLSRRSVFATVGAVAAGTLGGCSTLTGGSSEDDHVSLTSLNVINRRENSQTVAAQIRSAGELVVDERLELAGGDGALVQCEWPNSTGPFVVRVEHEQSGDSSTLRLDDVLEPPANVELQAIVRQRDRPNISLYYPTNPSDTSGCSDGTDATSR